MAITKDSITFDINTLQNLQKSNRLHDGNGFLRVDNCNITKACVSAYLGNEITNYKDYNLNPNQIYNVLRCPEELKKSYKTFEGLPLLNEHIEISSQSLKRDKQAGNIGSDLIMDETDHVKGSIFIQDPLAIKEVLNPNRKEPMGLSCGYDYDPVLEKGVYDGVSYDLKMTNIRGNHVALVDKPRVPTARVSDSAEKLTNKGEKIMNKVLFKLLGKKFAKDADMSDDDKADAIMAICMSPDLSDEEKKDQLINMINSNDDNEDDSSVDPQAPTVEDEEPDEVKPAVEGITEDKVQSMIENAITKAFKSAHEAASKEVKAMDSAIDIYEKVLGRANRLAFDGKPSAVYDAILKSRNIDTKNKSLVEKKAIAETISNLATNNTNTYSNIAMDSISTNNGSIIDNYKFFDERF